MVVEFTPEEVKAMIVALMSNWVRLDDQQAIYTAIEKLEKALKEQT
ncbi:MAG: hypothetical protein ABWY25_11495 [Paenisporosarcina sp.]|jgi:hypothetical protein